MEERLPKHWWTTIILVTCANTSWNTRWNCHTKASGLSLILFVSSPVSFRQGLRIWFAFFSLSQRPMPEPNTFFWNSVFEFAILWYCLFSYLSGFLFNGAPPFVWLHILTYRSAHPGIPRLMFGVYNVCSRDAMVVIEVTNWIISWRVCVVITKLDIGWLR